MPRIRSIHPEAGDSEKLSLLTDSAERTFFRLLTHADDDGRGEDRCKLLAAKLYPLHDDKNADTVDADLDELVTVGLLVRYVVDGRRFFVIPTFKDWQSPRHPRPSKYPGPEEADGSSTADGDTITANRGNGTANRRKAPAGEGVGGGEGVGEEHLSAPADPDVSPEARELTRTFALAVRGNGFKVPKREQRAYADWLTDMDRLIRLGAPGGEPDPQDPDEVGRVIAFATSDSFWSPNIGSPSKFREQYPKLRLRMLNAAEESKPRSRQDPVAARYGENAR
jgi:hypothetical protein